MTSPGVVKRPVERDSGSNDQRLDSIHGETLRRKRFVHFVRGGSEKSKTISIHNALGEGCFSFLHVVSKPPLVSGSVVSEAIAVLRLLPNLSRRRFPLGHKDN